VCIGSERETLLKFKHHLKDPSNRLSSWNATANSNCCQWDGVVCNIITSHIAELHLNTPFPTFDEDLVPNPLRTFDEDLVPNAYNYVYEELYEEYSRQAFGGEINACLVDLKHLNYLDISGNDFGSSPIPSFIATITSLTHLNLSHAGFTGNIPPHFENLSNLLYLDLSSNEFLGEGMPIPSFVGRMNTLIHLDLSNSGFMGIPLQIGNLSNLAYLGLRYVAYGTILSQIGNLTNLLYLDLNSYQFIENIDWLSSLSKLQYLDLGGAILSQSFQWLHTLQALPSLMHLQLSGCTLPPYNQSSFLNFSSLLTLDLSHIYYPSSKNFVPKWVFGQKKLVSLILSFNQIKGPIPYGLRNLTLLENLNLKENTISSSIPDWFYGSFPHLKFLDLSSNILQGIIPNVLENVTSLITLDLSSNQLKGPIPTSLGNVSSLIALDLSYNQLEGPIPNSLGNLTSAITLDLSHNQLEGPIPTSLGNMTSLIALDMSHNQLSGNLTQEFWVYKNVIIMNFYRNKIGGELPRSLEKLSSLRVLVLSSNRFSGNPFESLITLSKLSHLDIGDNCFQGVVKEGHLENLTNLSEFHASGNNLTLKVGPNWHPTFQLTYLDMSSWQLGPNFPLWIQSQNKNLQYLAMSNTGILDFIPSWFWETFSPITLLNLSHNYIHGELGTTLMNPISINVVDLSANNLCGKLPSLSTSVVSLDLSSNSFSKSMHDFLCRSQDNQMWLEFLNLASNNLLGEIPDCWGIWSYLVDINLQSNNFVGKFPQSMGSLTKLQSLCIRNNLLSGTFPTILKKINKLIVLDFGENNFSGTIPTWVGERLLDMKFLILRSNKFWGHIPDKICDMRLIQVLDLALNNLTGNIPTCFNSLKVMKHMEKFMMPFIGSYSIKISPILLEFSIFSVVLWLKGREDEYKSFLGLVTSIDLSNNKLVGEIPSELMDLYELRFLNLSYNQLSGHIPGSIGNMRSLLSIDFSRNKLSGEIPPTISNLSFLSMLDLSYNQLKGKIPEGVQLQTFDASNFIANNLCGPPLPISCSSNVKVHNFDHNDKGSDRLGVNWFFVTMASGFVVGFWIVVGPLFICRSWRYAYFHFLDHLWFKLQYIL